MIKRVKTARAARPRGGLLRWPHNVRIRSKLGVILLVPILAVVGLAVLRTFDVGRTLIAANEAYKLMEVSEAGAGLVTELQQERVTAVLHLQKGRRGNSELSAYWKRTDEAAKGYRELRNELQGVPETLQGTLNRIDNELETLTEKTRLLIYDPSRISPTDAAFQYRIVISDLLEFRQAMAQFVGDPVVADRIRAVAALSRAKEGAAREHIALLQAIHQGGFVASTHRSFIATLTAQESALEEFAALASPAQRELLSERVTGQEVEESVRLELAAARSLLNKEIRLAADDWTKAMDFRVDRIRSVEASLDDESKVSLSGYRNNIFRGIISVSLAVILTLFVAVLIALLVARSMSRSLRRLRTGALAVAYESLPQSVARLRNPETLGELTPDQVAAGVRDPVQVRGRDEIGQVSQAFNVVHREAVRIAAEQAALRANVATMFINLARRSQVLVDRLIGHLDRLERGEEDPDRLAELFQLDHLATRMRRNDENLLVLAGADSTRVQRDPAPLADVLRAAQSEVEQYTRIEFGIVDRDVELAPHAVNDVVHLLAELFDNATSFSPPDTVVVVDARRAGDRAILQIEDRGIGVSSEQLAELNARLASPPLVDVAVSRMMGLVVVGRLASRHGIRVELRAARDRGTIADVILPAGALILQQRSVRQQTRGLPQSRSPLALEGSPSRSPSYQAWQPTQPSGGWSRGAPAPSQGRGWERAGGPAPAGPPAPSPDRFDMGTVVGSGVAGPSNSLDPQLPRRRPGEGLSPTGEPVPTGGQPGDVDRHGPGRGSDRDRYARQGAVEVPAPEPKPRPANVPGTSKGGGRGQVTGSPGGPMPNGGSSAGAPAGVPAVPAKALDGRSTAKVGNAAPGGSPLIPGNVDDTMELPIFREVESAWFRTKQPQPTGDKPDRPSPKSSRRNRRRSTSGVTAASSQPGQAAGDGQYPSSDPAAWQTAADDGWRAASAAADPAGTGTTQSGLPKRVPMAQLVPGGVQTASSATRNRSPDAVRGLLSAYHRGVQRGRESSVRTTTEEGPGKEQA